jgi:hypothetical protein
MGRTQNFCTLKLVVQKALGFKRLIFLVPLPSLFYSSSISLFSSLLSNLILDYTTTEPSFPIPDAPDEHLKNSLATKATLALRSTASVLYNGWEGGGGFNFNVICFLSQVQLSSLLVSVRLFFGNRK